MLKMFLLHMCLKMTKLGLAPNTPGSNEYYKPGFEPTKNTPYLALTGELLCVLGVYFVENDRFNCWLYWFKTISTADCIDLRPFQLLTVLI